MSRFCFDVLSQLYILSLFLMITPFEQTNIRIEDTQWQWILFVITGNEHKPSGPLSIYDCCPVKIMNRFKNKISPDSRYVWYTYEPF